MMDNRSARLSIDEETAPLLRDTESEDGAVPQHSSPSLAERISAVIQEPLSPLTQVLLVVVLILLLLSSIFIGLFAGVQHKLNLERHNHEGDGGEIPPAETVTVTATTIATSTATLTTTSTTMHTTTGVPVPIPIPTFPPNIPKEETCLTPQCVILSASILSSLDTSQDPCENFYDFSNGGWLKSHPLPSDKPTYGRFEALAQENKQLIKSILEKKAPVSSPPSSDEQILRKLRDLYSSCMDEDELNAMGPTPLVDFVATIRRLYRSGQVEISAVQKDDDKEKNNITAALAFLHSRGIDALFEFNVEGDVGNDPNQMALWFGQPSLGLPSKEYYHEDSIREVYRNVIERLLLSLAQKDDESLIEKQSSSPILVDNAQGTSIWPPWPWPPWGGDEDGDDDEERPVNQTQRARELSKEVLKFETRLANASLDLEDLYDPIATYNPQPLDNLTSTLPEIDFTLYFSAFNPRAFPAQVIVTHPPFAASLSRILSNTSSDAIEAYLVTRAALTLAPYLGIDTEAWQAVRTLQETLRGIKKGAFGDRAEYCVGLVESALGFATGRYFVQEAFGGESREKGTKVITDIVKAFKSSLSHIEWMDKVSASAAAEKADAIRVKVGFPLSPDTRSADSIARYYGMVEVDDKAFFENMIHAATADVLRTWLQLGRRRDPEVWEMYPSTVNAYFNPPANEIVFPAGILRAPFFSQDWPGYLSYGAFGQVASHELTHAFDSNGRLYNQQGKLEEWWSNATSEGFNIRQQCIAKQYSAYTIDDGEGRKIHVNGNLTSGENIGDTGLVQAYRAWMDQYPTSFKAGNEYLLPGLNYTREQLFFISFARIWARHVTPAAAVARIRSDPHSPNPFRVDGTVFNIPDFAKAFNCSPWSKLNPPPEERCILW